MQNNGENQQQHQLAEDHYAFYEHFDRLTKNGRVCIDDLSAVDVSINDLTPQEENTRKAYTANVKTLRSLYDNRGNEHPIATTKEEVLQQRIVAPCLAFTYICSRSVANVPRAGRMYPQSIHPWNTFRQEVEGYKIDDDASSMEDSLKQIFHSSLIRAKLPMSAVKLMSCII